MGGIMTILGDSYWRGWMQCTCLIYGDEGDLIWRRLLDLTQAGPATQALFSFLTLGGPCVRERVWCLRRRGWPGPLLPVAAAAVPDNLINQLMGSASQNARIVDWSAPLFGFFASSRSVPNCLVLLCSVQRWYGLRNITLTFYFYINIHRKLKYVYFYKSILQDKYTHIVFIFIYSIT
jgi:hypothetical protein